MVPPCSVTTKSVKRFPRPRGDGPSELLKCVCQSGVPPPTRGWSPARPPRRDPARGSPAHAGMVPRKSTQRGGGEGFPRPRGDGPAIAGVSSSRGMVPPPTRGWSPHPHQKAPQLLGSPAHAGMVPNRQPACVLAPRFPRPRGDGPPFSNYVTVTPRVPPPTRGWSRRKGASRGLFIGSPAHAGMVPKYPDPFSEPYRFPRPRGDGPIRRSASDFTFEVPPPTRGWSPHLGTHLETLWGSPAHAGMVPPFVFA